MTLYCYCHNAHDATAWLYVTTATIHPRHHHGLSACWVSYLQVTISLYAAAATLPLMLLPAAPPFRCMPCLRASWTLTASVCACRSAACHTCPKYCSLSHQSKSRACSGGWHRCVAVAVAVAAAAGPDHPRKEHLRLSCSIS